MNSETKLIELKKEIVEKRNQTFADSVGGSREKQAQYLGMINAYDVCLNLIDKKLNENKGEILKGGESEA